MNCLSRLPDLSRVGCSEGCQGARSLSVGESVDPVQQLNVQNQQPRQGAGICITTLTEIVDLRPGTALATNVRIHLSEDCRWPHRHRLRLCRKLMFVLKDVEDFVMI